MAEKPRKLWLDWQRGLAVLFMVEWHTYDSWRADSAAQGSMHVILSIVGGFAAPSFLYMAGMSQQLADASGERKGMAAEGRRRHAIRRALWLLGVAYLFRAVEYLLGGAWRMPGGWEGILKVDVLNVIAVSLLAAAVLTVGVSGRRATALAIAAAAAVAFLAPVVAGWSHPPSRVLDYLYGQWPRAGFFLFPWAAFIFGGGALGRLALREPMPGTWVAVGAALFAAGWLGDLLPPVYAHQDFWVTSPSWLAIRLGIVVAMSGMLQLLPPSADRWLSWLRTMGRHSLLGYFVSVELPYGALSNSMHKRLSMGWSLVSIAAMSAVTWLAAVAADRYDGWKADRARRAAASPAA